MYIPATPAKPIYVLAGVHCSGAITGKRGPCDRACALMWHADSLMVDPEDTSAWSRK